MQPSQPERLPPRQQWVGAEKWPIVGERSASRPNEPWVLTLTGGAAGEIAWSLETLRHLPQTQLTLDLHCVTRWSKPDVLFSGVPLLELLDQAEVAASIRFVSFVARSTHNHSTSLTYADVVELQPLVALSVENQPLPEDHGGPIRLIVPKRYFYKSLKWLERIDLLTEDRLGTWEAEAGYHNHADPWLEQRFMAAGLSKREAAELIEAKDFRDRDLRGLAGQGRNLDRLQAAASALRDADLSWASMIEADFRGANLSGARLNHADLRRANFERADLEGCDFAGADLREAVFTGASLFGATFFDPTNPKSEPLRLGPTFPFEPSQVEMLTEAQQQYLRQCRLESAQ